MGVKPLVPSVQYHHCGGIRALLCADRFIESFPSGLKQQIRDLMPID